MTEVLGFLRSPVPRHWALSVRSLLLLSPFTQREKCHRPLATTHSSFLHFCFPLPLLRLHLWKTKVLFSPTLLPILRFYRIWTSASPEILLSIFHCLVGFYLLVILWIWPCYMFCFFNWTFYIFITRPITSARLIDAIAEHRLISAPWRPRPLDILLKLILHKSSFRLL